MTNYNNILETYRSKYLSNNHKYRITAIPPIPHHYIADIIYYYLTYKHNPTANNHLIYTENLHDYIHFFATIHNIPERLLPDFLKASCQDN